MGCAAVRGTEPGAGAHCPFRLEVPVVERCRRDGVLVITAGEKVLRLAPPLVIEQAELDEGLAVIERALISPDG